MNLNIIYNQFALNFSCFFRIFLYAKFAEERMTRPKILTLKKNPNPDK